jgi:hypothetical protein
MQEKLKLLVRAGLDRELWPSWCYHVGAKLQQGTDERGACDDAKLPRASMRNRVWSSRQLHSIAVVAIVVTISDLKSLLLSTEAMLVAQRCLLFRSNLTSYFWRRNDTSMFFPPAMSTYWCRVYAFFI